MLMPEVSIIVPVYNAEKYISKCIESIIKQTMKNIEIICIDDGSTDSSGKILDSFADKDSRVRVIHKKNEGLVAARKTGISHANGKYVSFADADDYMDEDMYDQLYSIAEKHRVDLVSSGYIYEGNYRTLHTDGFQEGLYVGKEMDYILENSIFNVKSEDVGVRGGLWCKLFKKEKLQTALVNVSDKLTFSEDKVIVLNYLMECKSVYITHRAYYHYIIHSCSMVNSANSNYLVYVNEVYKAFIKLYENPKFTDNMRLQAELYIVELLIKGINKRMGFQNKNLMWIDSYWIEKIPKYSRIVLYGAGELGETYYKQIKSSKYLEFVGCVDFGYEKYQKKLFDVQAPEKLLDLEYDYIVITIKNMEKANQIKRELINLGIDENKILWFRQKELYWKFAEVCGYLESVNLNETDKTDI